MTSSMVFDITLLHTFVVVADAGSFSRAADMLKRTQSSVSLHIKRLEDQAGKRLFVRTGRGVRLTAEGEIVFRHARKILRINDEAFTELLKLSHFGTVRLGIPQEFELLHLAPVVEKFRGRHPDVLLDVAVEPALALRQSLADSEFDLILVRQERSTGKAEATWREPLVWVGSKNCTVTTQEQIPLALGPEPCVLRAHALESLRRANRSWRVAFTSGSVASVAAAVKAGVGVSVYSRSVVPNTLVVLGDQHGVPRLDDAEIALMTAPAGLSQPAASLAKIITECLDQVFTGSKGDSGQRAASGVGRKASPARARA